MKTIVFIVGAGHSGSTLLAKTLNAHSKVFSLSEISNFHEDMNSNIAHCGCGILLKECPFWDEVNTLIESKLGYGIKEKSNDFRISRDLQRNKISDKIIFRISRFFAINLFFKTEHMKKRLRNIQTLFESVFDVTGSSVLIDSSKSAKRAYLLKNYFIKNGYNVKIIHLVRDGRAVLYSYLKGYYKVKVKNPDSEEYKMKVFHSNYIRSKEEIVKIWKKDNFESFYYHKILGKKKYYYLRYEDFANFPDISLKKMMTFLGLDYEREILDLTRFENHMVSGNASRINAEQIKKPFEEWKDKLGWEEKDYFVKKAGRLNRYLKYY